MYRSLTRSLPKVGARVVTPQGAGKVRYIFPLKKTVTVALEGDVNAEFGVDELLPPKQTRHAAPAGAAPPPDARKANAKRSSGNATGRPLPTNPSTRQADLALVRSNRPFPQAGRHASRRPLRSHGLSCP